MKIKFCRWLTALLFSFGSSGWAQAASTIQFTAATYTVAESAGAATLTVQRAGDLDTAVGVDYATADGTAANGLKYTAVSGTLAFAAGEISKTIEAPILNNGLVDVTKNFRVVLSNPTGGAVLGVRATATVSITDSDAGLQFQFAAYSVSEDAGQVLIGVARGDDGVLPVTVDFFTADLTGKSGLDYTGVSATLLFAAQERLKWVSIPILNNGLKQSSRTFRATLANAVGATLGGQKTTTVTIVDNDQGFQLDLAGYPAAEDAGVVRIGVLRGTDDTNSTVTIDFATSDGTAASGLDYSATTTTLTFAPGERVKLVAVPILNDGVKESLKKFNVILSDPTGGAVLGSRTSAAVTIVDNDPGIGFEFSSYSVSENAGAIAVTVLRGNDVDLGPITVDYATSDLIAKAGQDYQAISGTLRFERNETVKSIGIPIIHNRSVMNDTNFKVTLSNPTGGAILGRMSTTVSILDATGLGTFRTVAPSFITGLSIAQENGYNILTWRGGGPLQWADRLDGPWQTLPGASSPYTVQSGIPTAFYRVERPRSVNLYVPSSYDGQKALPLVILLHGYTRTGDFTEAYFQIQPLAEARGFLYCHPESLIDRAGNPYWNGGEACCDFWSSGVDDVGYLRGLIEEISSHFAVDRKRIHLFGWSNGGFMAYRMAGEAADLIAGIASFAGMSALDPNLYLPSQPVNILHIHGTADAIVSYDGSILGSPAFPANLAPFPSAWRSVQNWAEHNGSTVPFTDAAPSLDLTTDLPGLDTVVTRHTSSPGGGAVELWTINGGSHRPALSTQFAPRVIDWLLAHPKP